MQNYTLQLTELLLVDNIDEHGGKVFLHLRYGKFSPQVGVSYFFSFFFSFLIGMKKE